MRKIVYTLIATSFTSLFFGQVQTYHDTQGKIEVTNSGQATYTLPIALPPSIQDVGPTINLVYASGQIGGVAGQGWNIKGVSSISRIAARKDIDDFVDGVDFDDNDKLALDGQRLLLKTGTYWGENSIYETEIQSNLKVEMTGSGGNRRFIVTNTDGSKSYYGNENGYLNANTDFGHTFFINKFEDINGNVIEYDYIIMGGGTSDPIAVGKQYITSITFSKNINGNTTFLNRINFDYLPADRVDTSFLLGKKVNKSHVLKGIRVFTNELLFREYKISHTSDEIGYQRVIKIQEFNGAGEAANPVEFEYTITNNAINQDNLTAPAFSSFNDFNNGVRFAGDYNGDGRLDLVFGNQIYTKNQNNEAYTISTLPFTTNQRTSMIGTTVASNNTLGQKQNIINVNESSTSLSFVSATNVVNNYTQKSISSDNSLGTYDPSSNVTLFEPYPGGNGPSVGCVYPTEKFSNEYLEGDFNGDGISEVLFYRSINERYYFKTINYYMFNYNNIIVSKCETKYIDDGKECFLVDLNPNTSTTLGEVGYLSIANSVLLQGDKKFVNDYNGDGKSDVLVINNNGEYKLIGFKQLLQSPWVELELLGEGNIDWYSTNKQILFGDFNGDAKVDIMLPQADGDGCEYTDGNGNPTTICHQWKIYYGMPTFQANGFTFSTMNQQTITAYMPLKTSSGGQVWRNVYYAIDINKDGKSDLVRFEIWDHEVASNYREEYRTRTFLNVAGRTDGAAFIHTNDSEWSSSFINGTIPVFTTSKLNSKNSDFMVIKQQEPLPPNTTRSHYFFYYSFNKNTIKDNLITKVTKSDGNIIDEIEYSPMVCGYQNSGLGLPTDIYSANSTLVNYPYLLFQNFPSMNLVSRLKTTELGNVTYQDFKYQSFLAHTQGQGFLGFKKTARSSRYRNSSDKKIWEVAEIDPLKRGANKLIYKQILNGDVPFSFTITSIVPSNIEGLISKTENTYFTETLTASKKYTLLLNKQKTTDYLTSVINEVTYGYSSDGYNLPSSVISKNYLGTTLQGTTTTTTLFDNVTSGTSGYYIGRPSEITTTTYAYGNYHTTYEKLFYENGNITRKEKKVGTTSTSIATATETLIEIMSYFPNGNLMSKTISSSGFPVVTPALSNRTISYTYDPTSRFVKTITDADGVVNTNDTYHPLYGLVTQQTNNTLAQTTKYEFDNWGKKTKTINYLNKYTNFLYIKENNIFKTFEYGEDAHQKEVQTDIQGRVIKKINKNINGGTQWSYVDIEYDWKGRKYRESEPYFISDTPLQNYFSYDDYDRPIQTLESNTKITTIEYDGLNTIVNDGTIEKTTTKNANGHLVSSSDNSSGIINYTYDAAGNMLTSGYDGATLTMTYDLWGRKKSINDPSGDVYSYDYNAYGEIIKETTPKGFTEYTYTPSGKIATKRVRDALNPTNTDITSTYTYHPTLKWLTNLAVTNPYDGNSNYVYTYDYGSGTNTKQLKKTVETLYPIGGGTVTFTKEFAFDSFGRVLREISTAAAHGKTSTKTTNNVYSAGKLYKIFDGTTATGTPLWQATYENEREQITHSSFGNGTSILNTYDQFGFPEKIEHTLAGTTPVNIMTLDAQFDIVRGNLKSRKYSMLSQKENFYYDNLDRLEIWNSEGATLMFSNFNSGGLDGFTSVLGASVTNNVSQQRLRISSNTSNAGAEKKIISNAAIGQTIKITGFNFIESASGTIYVGVYEKDPITQAVTTITNPVELSYSNPSFDFNYKVTTYSDVYIKFYFVGTYAVYSVDEVKVVEVNEFVQSYHDNGRIDENKLGTYNYNKVTATPPRPYQNTSITLTDEGKAIYGAKSGQVISYNAIQRPIQITEGPQKIDFGYNAMQQRMVMYYGNANATKTARPYRKYYSFDGSMEIEYTLANSTTTPVTAEKVRFLTYVGGDAYSAPLVVERVDAGTYNNFYLHRDYQGSIVTITNNTGAIVEKRMFDPWGEVVKVQDGAGNNLTKLTFLDRGYTGHEHLQAVGLINMNARLYDPKLHRLLQPDNYIQDPTNTQDYNRYAYAHNNPLKYVDTDGNNPALLIGIGVALVSYFVGTAINHQKITVGGVTNAILWGFMSSAVSFGIGEATSTITTFATRAVVQSIAHGASQGGLSSIQGGNFWSSFASGSISSLAASGWSGIGGDNTDFGMIAFGTISGGAGAALTGGNFWQGAVTGLIVSGLNHYLHDTPDREKIKKINKEIRSLKGKCVPGQASVNKVKNLATIKSIASRGGNPDVNFIDSEVSMRGASGDFHTNTEEINPDSINSVTDFSKGSHINVYRSAFDKGWRGLTEIILHEYAHAISRYQGYFQEGFNNLNGNLAAAYDVDEVFAYQYQTIYGFSMYNSGTNIYLPGLQKALNNLNLTKW